MKRGCIMVRVTKIQQRVDHIDVDIKNKNKNKIEYMKCDGCDVLFLVFLITFYGNHSLNYFKLL